MPALRNRQSTTAAASAPDHNVVAHPAFRDIPKCIFPLRTAEAAAEYDTLARMLFDAGKLTIGAHRALSSYAIQFDNITDATTSGKQPRGSWFAQLDKARSELRLDDIDKPIAAPANAPANKYARNGFPSRRR